MKQSWLKENTTSILAIMWSVSAIVIFILVLTKDIKSDDKTSYMIVQGMFGTITFILGYYYGASKQRPQDIPKEDNSVNINSNNQKTDTP